MSHEEVLRNYHWKDHSMDRRIERYTHDVE